MHVACAKNVNKTMYGFFTSMDIFTTFALPWVGVLVGFCLGWLTATVRQMRKEQK